MSKKKQSIILVLFILAMIVIDQWIKMYVKTHFALHECYEVTSWFKLLFIENNGMAFGIELGAKLFLTLFRLVACGVGVWYIVRLIRRSTNFWYTMVIALILAGAVGNIIDCMFYGLIFDAPYYGCASFVPFGEGYGHFLEGRVVDMFYFPLFEFDWPTWMPLCGGNHFIFFSPIFNFADSCVTCGVFLFLIFFHDALKTDNLELLSGADNTTDEQPAEPIDAK